MSKQKSTESKINSHLQKDINRIKKAASKQMKINILRKHQIRLLNEFIKKLIKQKRITKQELIPYMPKKRNSEKSLFKNKNNLSLFL